ncbi:hypothetical protein BURCENBC7_AP2955 [Burkholderia cenocepacia BC7]|nr:hypothetical protein BURCENBC7_AP2955 [Burkholderia cenocepacia BC7]
MRAGFTRFISKSRCSSEHSAVIKLQCYLTTDHFRTSYVRMRIRST